MTNQSQKIAIPLNTVVWTDEYINVKNRIGSEHAFSKIYGVQSNVEYIDKPESIRFVSQNTSIKSTSVCTIKASLHIISRREIINLEVQYNYVDLNGNYMDVNVPISSNLFDIRKPLSAIILSTASDDKLSAIDTNSLYKYSTSNCRSMKVISILSSIYFIIKNILNNNNCNNKVPTIHDFDMD